ncbi:MAG: hypothetical protein AABP62_08900 [Planctomycetota bacterium]
MRTRQWLASLLSGCLAVAGGLSAYAQAPPFPQYGPGNPDAVGMLPPPYNTNYGTVPQSYTGMEQAGYPPGANAWPNVSPYMGPAVDQTAYEDGNWFNRQLTGNRKYYFSTEVLIGSTQRGSNVRIGAYGVNEVEPPPPGSVWIDHNQLFFESVVLSGINNMPDRFVNDTGGGGNNGSTGDYPIFVEHNLREMKDPAQAAGVRTTWGWFNPDQSGFQVSGFWLQSTASTFFTGTGLPYDETDAIFYPGYNERHLRAFSGLPLGGADSDGDGRPGFVMPFDIFYRLQFESQLAGSNVDWYGSSIYERPSLMIRPVAGARFVQLRERFNFDGSDSGLGYTIQPATATTGGGGTATSNQVFGPEQYAIDFDVEFLIPDVLNAHVTSQSQSLLAGPEAGLRFDIGGDHFKVWTQSKFGLLANNTRQTLSGFNIGDAHFVRNGRTIPVMPRNSPDLTTFAHQHTTTWMSPMFEQSIFCKSHLFQFVPVLNKARILNQAEFQAGYTLLILGQVARPAEQIDWQAYSNDANRGPLLKTDRTTYTNGTFSLGVEWTY